MDDLTLVIGNKNYSSWSLKAWLTLKAAEAEFEEILIPLGETNTRQEILRHWRNGKVPILKHGDITVWESLSICEYIAELFPKSELWPLEVRAKVVARSICSEIHAGFNTLNQYMPMNVRSRFPDEGRETGVQEDINRITAIWRRGRDRYGQSLGGPFLFGKFTIVDAMFAPIVCRFRTYDVDLGDIEAAYADAIWEYPAMQEWAKSAQAEPMVINSAEF